MFEIDDDILIGGYGYKGFVKINNLICNTCEKSFQSDGKNKNRKYCSKKCYGAWRATLIKEKHHLWKGGISKYDYETTKAMNTKKKLIGKCEKCGNVNNLHAHHILSHSKHPDLRANQNNIKILCSDCHALEHPQSANALSYPRKRSGINIKCVACGKERYVRPNLIKTAKYCSKECRATTCQKNRKSKLTREQCNEIINIVITDNGKIQKAMRKFSVSKATVNRIRRGNYKIY